MKTTFTKKSLAIASLLALGATSAMADVKLQARLNGYNQVPSIYTDGVGTFSATANNDYIDYQIAFKNLTSPLTEAHIHFAQAGANGGTMVVFCDSGKACNLGNTGSVLSRGSVGQIQGRLTKADVLGISGQNVKKNKFKQLLNAIANGAAYVNLHTSKFDGEVRGQIEVMKIDPNAVK